ncbi:hypothetical protein [Rathayibacter rathayi]|uniref:hypothetical protein n=1 Tax=Rathayibacter rathayi TaxID=33887 RepID=UPI0011B09A7D|nr:hypothetical protein [Rathayibacter rathayi]
MPDITVLVSAPDENHRCAGTCFALSFIFTHQIDASAGIWLLFAARVVASAIVALAALLTRQASPLRGRTLLLAVGIGLLDVIANVTMVWACVELRLSATCLGQKNLR